MKRHLLSSLLLFAAAFLAFQTTTLTAAERRPYFSFTNGNIQQIGPGDRKFFGTVPTRDGMAVFDGASGVAVTPTWFYPGRIDSLSYVADVIIDALPQPNTQAAICGRSGFHNGLIVQSDGRIKYGCFGRKNPNRSAALLSKTCLQVGQLYRVAGTLECQANDETILRLYINGRLEGTAVLKDVPRAYSRDFFVGCIGYYANRPNKPLELPFSGRIRNVFCLPKALTSTEICALPGLPQAVKETWEPFQKVKLPMSLPMDVDGAAELVAIPTETPLEEFSATLQFSFDALPQKTGVIFGRKGFDNAIMLLPDGHLRGTFWNEKTTDACNVFTKIALKPKVTYKLHIVMEQKPVETILSLYVNDVLAARGALTGRPYGYENSFWLGGIPTPDNSPRALFAFHLYSCEILPIAIHP